ncbi:MAG: TIGR03668 family PPOX class F420-dependent oxidoreductase [Acidimicrobiales bacterium]
MHGEDEARHRFADAPVARLATVTPDGAPHLVPVTFVLDGDVVWWAVDAKPKRHRSLRRLENIAAEPRVSLLVDHYDDDWDQLWWVRADGVAAVVAGAGAAPGLAALAARYPAYRAATPEGPVVRVDVRRWRWWSPR